MKVTGGIISLQCIGHSLWREQDGSGEPNAAHCEIEAARELGKGADFRVVNPAETVGCIMRANAPHKCDEHDSFEVPNGEARRRQPKNRRKNEAPFEALNNARSP